MATVDETGNDRLMVGFNRRFAPLLDRPRAASARPAATRRSLPGQRGPARPGSWYLNEELEGVAVRRRRRPLHRHPRLVARTAAHRGVRRARSRRRRRRVTLRFAERLGRHDQLRQAAAARGSRRRRWTSPAAAATAGWTTSRATVWTGRKRRTHAGAQRPDKGQRIELGRFVAAVRSGGPMPISFDSLIATTRATIAVDAQPRERPP